MNFLVLLRGGGDLASGIALRLTRIGIPLVITELPQPMAVRRLVSFCQAIFDEEVSIEGIVARRVASAAEVQPVIAKGQIPVLADSQAECRYTLKPDVIVDCRMTKHPPDLPLNAAPLVVGVGPGFIAGVNCHAAVESKRGHYLGRVIWQGKTEEDTGEPESVASHQNDRVLRAPANGIFTTQVKIGSFVKTGMQIAEVDGHPIRALFDGYLRGLLHDGLPVTQGIKVGDIDPRFDPQACHLISDKALSVGGGVLEAILSKPEFRHRIWC